MKHKAKWSAIALALLLLLAPVGCSAEQMEEADTPVAELPTPALPEEEPAGDPDEAPATPEETPEEPSQPEEPAEEQPEEPEAKDVPYIRVVCDAVNVRAGMSMQSSVLGKAKLGTMLTLVRKQGNWYETIYRGRRAYVSADARYTSTFTMTAAEAKIEQVISEGVALMGTPYVYGAIRLHDGKGFFLDGFSVQAFDCSSLMQYIFYEGAGLLLDVTTRTQVKQGEAVSRAEVERGDLLFYTNASRKHLSGVERIGHVALYLGDNYILHTASDYAVIEPISATRESYFITARRFL